jgi:hypothetical protein
MILLFILIFLTLGDRRLEKGRSRIILGHM